MIESMLIGEIKQKTKIRFRNIEHFETYNNALHVDNDSEDVVFTGWLYKLNTPEFNKVNRSEYGRETNFKQEIVEYIGSNIFIPTSTNCLKKCIKYLTCRDSTEDF